MANLQHSRYIADSLARLLGELYLVQYTESINNVHVFTIV